MSFDCKHENIEVKALSETYEVLGEIVKVTSRVKVCKDCGEKIFDTDFSKSNMLQAYSTYRKNHDLLDHDELKKVREDIGISQHAMGVLLGVDSNEVKRHENGAIQTRSYDQKIRKMMTLEGLAEVMLRALYIADDDAESLREFIHRKAAE